MKAFRPTRLLLWAFICAICADAIVSLGLLDHFFQERPAVATEKRLAEQTQKSFSPYLSASTRVSTPSAAPRTGPKVSALANTTQTLKGTQIDGRLEVDAHGNFIPNRQALLNFDYFLLSAGEIGRVAALDALKQHINTSLQRPARAQALTFLAQYLDYSSAMEEYYRTQQASMPLPSVMSASAASDKGAQLLAHQDKLNTLRQQHFGLELSSQLFPVDRRILNAEQLKLLSDDSLSPSAKIERAQSLRQPADLALERQLTASKQLTVAVEQLRQQGASPEDIHHYRSQRVGAEAAQRLAKLDEQRSHWKQRVERYLEHYNQISNTAILEPEQRANMLEQLTDQHFNAREQLRLKAYIN